MVLQIRHRNYFVIKFLPANSNRLKPFRSIVRGYTGQQKKPGIRDHISFNHQAHESKTKMFQNFIN